MLRLLFVFLLPFLLQNALDLGAIRQKYSQAIDSEEETKALDLLLTNDARKSNTVLGYKGAVKMLMAKHVFFPNQKLVYFMEGKNLLEKAILAEPINLELLYLRYGVQLNSPSFLGYNQNLLSDRSKLIAGVKAVKDRYLKNEIRSILILKGDLNAIERKQIQ
ncbi:MAG: hypothetical protein SGJ00_11875 [bacterium]|nr:hypothetical protein [bacterium]